MPLATAPPEPIETRRPWSGILIMGIFGAVAVAMMSIATRVLLPQRTTVDPVLPWFLGFRPHVFAFADQTKIAGKSVDEIYEAYRAHFETEVMPMIEESIDADQT